MTAEQDGIRAGIRHSRFRVPRSRGALSGFALLILGAWAGIVPFIGPYFSFAYTPAPTDAWHWTAGRGWLDVLPGAAAFVAGLILLVGTNRVSLSFASWLGIASGAWLVVGPVLAPQISINAGTPDPTSASDVQMLEQLFFYYALGAAILFFAASALGRLSVHGVREVRAAQRRAEADAARQEEERRLAEQRVAEQQAAEREQTRTTSTEEAGVPRHERAPGEPPRFAQTGNQRTEQVGPSEAGQPPRT